MLRKIYLSLLVTLFIALPFLHYPSWNKSDDYSKVLSKKIPSPVSKEVLVSARVGKQMINILTGWTSPFAEVNLSSLGLIRKTTADETGFFAFYFVPVLENLGEICLISQDIDLLPTFPVCLAPPLSNQDIEIRDVLLPPSISLESAKIPVGRTTKASGMTFPSSEVDVYLFTEKRTFLQSVLEHLSFPFFRKQKTDDRGPIADKTENRSLSNPVSVFCYLSSVFRPLSSGIVKPVSATGLPLYRTKSNKNGYFEFSLPASFPSNNRVFASSDLSEDLITQTLKPPLLKSPKSNTLAFQALGFLGIIKLFLQNLWQELGGIFSNLKVSPLNNYILVEIAILIGLILAFFARYLLKQKVSIPIPVPVPNPPLVPPLENNEEKRIILRPPSYLAKKK